VGVDVVRELFGVMAARGAVGGFVVTAGNFSADARAFAEGRNIDLIAGNAAAHDRSRRKYWSSSCS
ncbi:MAG: restriction endonuclease, partial [Burkholderiales bacterium]|nr:restriction endonuclease [Burkholderiales bacterium]